MSTEAPIGDVQSSSFGGEVRRVRDAAELSAAMAIRQRVFCAEQGVPLSDEVDGRDSEGLHLVAVEDGTVVATCRICFVGSTAQFSRLAVDKPWRRKGIATLLLDLSENESRSARARRMVLHAQTYALPLYEKTGWRARGAVFRDSGIDHVAMEKRLA
jgi:predicted GNAT family N-acyltransferase